MRATQIRSQSYAWGRRAAAPPSSITPKTESLLRVMTKTSGRFYLLSGLALAVIAWFLYAWGYKLEYGEIALGLGDWGPAGGVTWGLYIGMFIWWVGIAHGGILVSAAVRLFKVRSLAPVARVAELMALVALPCAVSGILMQLGRLDRVVTSIVPIYPRSIQHSPLIWDVTVITLYFVLTGTYILLTLRHDVYVLKQRLPHLLTPLYRLLTIGYQPEEDEKIERMVWWLALGLIILAPLLLHGGVIPWLQLQLNINGLFAPPLGVEKSTAAKLETPAYWLAIGFIAGPMIYLAAQMLFPRLFSVARTTVAGVLVVVAVFVEKTLFVAEGLMHPAFRLYQPGTYFPSWVEISGVVGTIPIVVLYFTVIVKVIPVIEVSVLEEG